MPRSYLSGLVVNLDAIREINCTVNVDQHKRAIVSGRPVGHLSSVPLLLSPVIRPTHHYCFAAGLRSWLPVVGYLDRMYLMPFKVWSVSNVVGYKPRTTTGGIAYSIAGKAPEAFWKRCFSISRKCDTRERAVQWGELQHKTYSKTIICHFNVSVFVWMNKQDTTCLSVDCRDAANAIFQLWTEQDSFTLSPDHIPSLSSHSHLTLGKQVSIIPEMLNYFHS